jgi:hypothetical protein
MTKKILKTQTIFQLSPEIMFFFAQLFIILSIYNVFFLQSRNWELTTISVSLAFAFINFTIICFSLRPYSFSLDLVYKKQNNNWGIATFFIFFIFMFIYVSYSISAIFAIKTSYVAAQLIIFSGVIFSLLLAVGTFFAFKSPGINRKIKKTISIRYFLIIIYLVVAALAWHIADWNPTLTHYTSEVKIIKTNGIEGIKKNDICYIDVGTYSGSVKKNKCRIRFFCNGKKLFGGIGLGMVNSKVSLKDDSIYIKGADNSVTDGDPAFSIDTKRGLIRFSKKYSLKYRSELTGKILGLKLFPFYY